MTFNSSRNRPPREERNALSLAKLLDEGKIEAAREQARKIIAEQSRMIERRREQFKR